MIDFVSEVFIIKVTVKENSFKWNLQRDTCCNVESLENFYFRFQVIYNLTIKRDKVSRHLLIFRIFGSDVPQRSSLGPFLFLIHIDNLSNDIVALAIKQRYGHAHTSAGIE